jgi:hypothetical protein
VIYEDFVAELAAAGISGREFARLLRLNLNTVAGYKARGDVPSHWVVIAALMRLLKENGVPFEERIRQLAIEPKARRGKAIAVQALTKRSSKPR